MKYHIQHYDINQNKYSIVGYYSKDGVVYHYTGRHNNDITFDFPLKIARHLFATFSKQCSDTNIYYKKIKQSKENF